MEGFNYIGMGNSTNKKDAQSNAARDFVNFLVRQGKMSSSEVPALGVSMGKCLSPFCKVSHCCQQSQRTVVVCLFTDNPL